VLWAGEPYPLKSAQGLAELYLNSQCAAEQPLKVGCAAEIIIAFPR